MGTHFSGTSDEIRALDVYIKLSRASDSVSYRINRHLKDHNLSTSQFGVLEALLHLGPMCQSELATKILKSTGNLTMVVDHLEERGLVERRRESSDRRFVTVHLTEAGEALIAGIFAEHVAGVVREIGVLAPDEQVQLAGLCRKLGRGVEQTRLDLSSEKGPI